MKQLEEDFGIYLDSENAIEEIYHATNNIFQFNDLKYYIGNNYADILIEIFSLIFCLQNNDFIDNKFNEHEFDPVYLYINEIKKAKEKTN